ncbi:MAG TPA: carboxypeptidase-like regulatory domain-containing protein [Planctomycetota bacterium]|jgi:hypothetical protein|nr:carboxypeptidase-like regulatory domain-containing protein [Planctomycetota bacterium]
MRDHGSARLPLLLLAFAFLGAVVGALLFSSGGDALRLQASAPTSTPTREGPAADEPPMPLAPDRTGSPAERQSVAAAPETKPGRPPLEPALATLEARIVDTFGSPLPSARLRSGRNEAFSGADGLVLLRLSPPRPGSTKWNLRLEASLLGYATRFLGAELVAGETTRLGDVVLHPGGTVVGRVVDPSNHGLPNISTWTTEATLSDFDATWARFHGPSSERGPSTATGEDGGFRIEGVTPGFVRVWASGEGTPYSFSPPVEVHAGQETREVTLVLEPFAREDLIEGGVVGPDGAPVPRALLRSSYKSEHMSGSTSGAADEGGHFRFVLYPRAPRDLRACDPGARWSDALAKGVVPGTLDLKLRLSEPKWVEVRVRDESGAAVERFAAQAYPSETSHRAGSGPGERHDGGIEKLRILPEPFFVCVVAPNFEESDQGPFDPETAPSTVECRLRPLPGVTGRVLADEKPKPGARLALHRAGDSDTRIEYCGFPARLHPNSDAEGETDPEGRFRLTLRQDGKFFLRAEAEGFAATEAGPFEIRAAAGLHGIEVPLGRGGAIEGRVIAPPDRDANGVVVAINRGDAHPQTQRVGPDGRYRFDRLTPGRWMVDERETMLDPGHTSTGFVSGSDVKEAEIPWVCEVVEGQTTRYDLDLSGSEGPVLLGQLLVDGEPAGGWTAVLRPHTGGFVVTGRDRQSRATDRDGRFTIPFPPGDRFRLALESDPGSQGSIRLTDAVVAQPRENNWRLDLPTGRLEGEKASPSSANSGPYFVLWSGRGELRASIPFTLDADGRFSLPRVPAGQVRIARPGPGGPESNPSTWPTLLEADVAPGRVNRLSIP